MITEATESLSRLVDIDEALRKLSLAEMSGPFIGNLLRAMHGDNVKDTRRWQEELQQALEARHQLEAERRRVSNTITRHVMNFRERQEASAQGVTTE